MLPEQAQIMDLCRSWTVLRRQNHHTFARSAEAIGRERWANRTLNRRARSSGVRHVNTSAASVTQSCHPSVRSVAVIGRGLWGSPGNRRSSTAAAKTAVMCSVVRSMSDDDEKPPPCPWCNVSGVVEITAASHDASGDTRWFRCQSCSRVFFIHIEPLQPPQKDTCNERRRNQPVLLK